MFIGQSYPSFESKKRLVLPAKYRNELGEEFYGLVDFDHCISLYPSSLYQKRAESIDSLDNFSSDNRLLKRLFFGNSCELKIDKVGRVLIPQTILDKAHIKLDKEVKNSLLVTFKFVLMSVPMKLLSALIIAMLLNQSIKGIGIFRTVYYLPSILGGSVAVAILWRHLFDLNGVVNHLLNKLGICE